MLRELKNVNLRFERAPSGRSAGWGAALAAFSVWLWAGSGPVPEFAGCCGRAGF